MDHLQERFKKGNKGKIDNFTTFWRKSVGLFYSPSVTFYIKQLTVIPSSIKSKINKSKNMKLSSYH